MEKEYDVIGIGNLLMDVLVQVDDEKLMEFDLKKGTMKLIEEEKVNEILEQFDPENMKLTPAGACSNTIMGLAKLGGRGMLVGKVGKDKHGDYYEDIITKKNVVSKILRCNKNNTGRVICFITPDAERTFTVHLGAAVNIVKEEMANLDVGKGKFFYLTGYMIENTKETAMHFMKQAKEKGVKIVVDLADPELIKRNKELLKEIVQTYVDILLVNEAEVEAYTGMKVEEREEAKKVSELLAKEVDISVVKLGEKGSVIRQGEQAIAIDAHNVKAIDTTGAGDLYAAGLLYGLSNGKGLEDSGKIGAFLAGKVVSQIGALIEEDVSEEIEKMFG